MKKNLANKRYPKEVNSEMYFDNNTIKNEFKNNLYEENSNILLNSLKFFFNSYETKNQQQSSKIKFIISFEEIISLIYETIISQKKVDNLLYNNNNAEILIQKINQKFISYLSNSIYTLEIFYKNFRENMGLSRHNSNFNYNYNYHTIKNPPKKMKNHGFKTHFSSPSNFKNKINYIFENIYQEVFINDNDKNKGSKNYKRENSLKSNETNDRVPRTKSAILGKKNNSPLSYYRDIKNQEKSKEKNKRLFKTTYTNGRSSNNSNSNSIYIEKKYSTALSSNKKSKPAEYETDKFLGGYKTFKHSKKTKKLRNNLKCSDIFLACENISKLKHSCNIKSLQKNNIQYQYNEYDDKNSILKKSLKNLAVGIQDICNNTNDIIGYEEINLKGSGIKKIIVSNTHKPSNFTNKLLMSGQKFINDFKQMDKFEKKRNINNNQY